MKLETVIVCDKYADFLAETLPHSRHLFNRLVVVTSHEDRDTQRVCEYWNVQCVRTDVLESRKGNFAKGSGINEGLAALDRDGWVVHMDADIVLPPLTRNILESIEDLDPACLYGCDRFMVRNHQDWRRFMEMPRLQHENGSWLHLGAFEIGTRVVIPGYGGYIPIGFFQLWNPAGSNVHEYPDQHKSAARTDLQFAMLWPRAKRHFLPELVVYHLESEHAPMASNWGGRSTLPFTHDQQARQIAAPVAWHERRAAQSQQSQPAAAERY